MTASAPQERAVPLAAVSGERRAWLRAVPALVIAPAWLTGCDTLSNSAPRFDFFVIEDLGTAGGAAARHDRTLLLTTGPTQALYDSDRIVFTPDGASRSYYQYSNWSERPLRRIVALAEARLAARGGFRAVAQTLSGVRGDLVLTLRLDELIHDASPQAGRMRVGIDAELVDWRTRRLVARERFARAAAVDGADARGAAAAANRAVTAVLDGLAPWVEQVGGAPPT